MNTINSDWLSDLVAPTGDRLSDPLRGAGLSDLVAPTGDRLSSSGTLSCCEKYLRVRFCKPNSRSAEKWPYRERFSNRESLDTYFKILSQVTLIREFWEQRVALGDMTSLTNCVREPRMILRSGRQLY